MDQWIKKTEIGLVWILIDSDVRCKIPRGRVGQRSLNRKSVPAVPIEDAPLLMDFTDKSEIMTKIIRTVSGSVGNRHKGLGWGTLRTTAWNIYVKLVREPSVQ